MKTCSKCGVLKYETEFTLRSDTRKFRNACKKCQKEDQKLSVQRWRKRHPDFRYLQGDYLRKSRFGLTREEIDRMAAGQNNTCAICNRPNKNRRLCVDHDHNSGETRGLLCTKCNAALGLFNDDPKVVQSATNYLLRFRQPETVSNSTLVQPPAEDPKSDPPA